LADVSGIHLEKNSINKTTAFLLLLVLALLVFNSLFKLNIVLNLFILLLAGSAGYLIYKIVMEDESRA
jgi:Ca2+/Na+ antiporter